MIPTVLMIGFPAGLLGRRGLWFLLVAAFGWPVMLAATGVETRLDMLLGAAGLATLNALAGILAGYGLRWVIQNVRRARPSSDAP